MYLTYFSFPDEDQEIEFIWNNGHSSESFYPFKVLSACGLERLDFAPITILYGGNGSGKSTALNLIAEKLDIKRDSILSKSHFYNNYLNMCKINILDNIPENSRIITSDDVFDFMLNIRNLNEGIKEKKDELIKEYLEVKYSDFKFKTISDYDKLKKVNTTRSVTQSQYVKDQLMKNVRELSNGESAFRYFTEKIDANGLYILDEPGNSLSPKGQLELKSFIEDSVRFYGCQFIISTHSPFLLSLAGAKIYDLDARPCSVEKWTELENIKIYRKFFKDTDSDFSE